ncbi:GSCOCG00000716001-RA-CDS [Cotesia congregata]|nr:GSCOCG00000716001-RA-CDS [Cotesia congregata]
MAYYDLSSIWNGTKPNEANEFNLFENPAKLGVLTGLIIALFIESQYVPAKFDNYIKSKLKNVAFMILNISCFLLTAPVISILLVTFFIYRQIVCLTLKITLGEKFAGLLEGTDCVWAIEDPSALSVINILGVLELNSLSNGINILEEVRALMVIKERLLLFPSFEKLFWKREKKYGYYFWRRSGVNLEERVRLLDVDHSRCKETCNYYREYLREIIAQECNKPLPENHSMGWEILILQNCQKKTFGSERTVSLLFRVHHCVGDGVALLRLLLEAIADSSNSKVKVQLLDDKKIKIKVNQSNLLSIPILRRCSSIYGSLKYSSDVVYYSSDVLSAAMPFAIGIPLYRIFKSFQKYLKVQWELLGCSEAEEMKVKIIKTLKIIRVIIIETLKKLRKVCKNIFKNIMALILIPDCLFRQACLSFDESALHGPELTGNKKISCWIEDTSDSHVSLLEKIRDIKNITDTRFGDVVLAALSANLYKHFHQIGKTAPKKLTIVIPARMSKPNQKLALKNRFSVGLLPLCISEVNGICCEPTNDPRKLLDRLRDVSRSTRKLRTDPDYLINYWVMTWFSAALPEVFLRTFLKSYSTMVFSNLPGPQAVAVLGHTLKKVAFWIPSRGTTGIGCSLLTYNGNVHLSLQADEAVVSEETSLDEILKGTIDDIKALHDIITLPCFAKSFLDTAEAPMETGTIKKKIIYL